MRIAILGATSQIAKNLISRFSLDPEYELFLFARNETAVQEFLRTISKHSVPKVLAFGVFSSGEYDAVINCVGIGDPRKLNIAGIELFRLTERYDNLVLDYLFSHQQTVYVNFSSGAVYGTAFDTGVTEESAAVIAVNNIEPADYYRIAKLNSEAKHRAMSDRKIIDLRVFSFFSSFIDLESGFLLCEMTRCAKEHRTFHTNAVDIIRDYIAPSDLFALVELCLKKGKGNLVLDVYSAKPVRKSELIDLFEHKFGLKTQVDENSRTSATGTKLAYYSSGRTAERALGYIPKITAIAVIKDEIDSIVSANIWNN
jgi:nucleoside-diphosphate-sugar epimerase